MLIDKRVHLVLIVGIIGMVALGGLAEAQSVTYEAGNNVLDRVPELYESAAEKWQAPLEAAATRLFWLLASIEFAWAAAMLVMRNASGSEFLATVVNQIMFIGFFGHMLTMSHVYAGAIIRSFQQAANQAVAAGGGSSGLTPADVFDTGVELFAKVATMRVSVLPWEGIAEGIGILIIAICIFMAYLAMTALMIIAIVESYVVINAGVLMMGFGGSRWTKDFAIKQITYGISVGAKLFMVQLIAGTGETVMREQINAIGATDPNMVQLGTVLGFAVVLTALAKSIPATVQGLINGVSPGGHGALTGAASAAAGAAVGVAGVVAGAGMAASGAVKLASEQVKASGATGAKAVGMGAMRTVGNLASAAATDVGAVLSGQRKGGRAAGRMGHDMHTKAEAMRERREAPEPPTSQNAEGGQGGNGGAAKADAQFPHSGGVSGKPLTVGAGPEPAASGKGGQAAQAAPPSNDGGGAGSISGDGTSLRSEDYGPPKPKAPADEGEMDPPADGPQLGGASKGGGPGGQGKESGGGADTDAVGGGDD